jgi:peptidoglycan/LPS O-acetylase OafA/YrhL
LKYTDCNLNSNDRQNATSRDESKKEYQAHSRHFRGDIQAARGIAIILVLLHHAHFPYSPGGFLGVDMFFVISGFLMTSFIDDALKNRSFTFMSFYTRRVKRLFPAAYATLAVTTLAAPFLLDSFELQSFAAQLLGSFTFTVNFVLWRQSDYFAHSADLKPLLHMWSLSIEEQFYIILPLLMFLSPTRFRLALGIILVLLVD